MLFATGVVINDLMAPSIALIDMSSLCRSAILDVPHHMMLLLRHFFAMLDLKVFPIITDDICDFQG
jgi:hypothetical protein